MPFWSAIAGLGKAFLTKKATDWVGRKLGMDGGSNQGAVSGTQHLDPEYMKKVGLAQGAGNTALAGAMGMNPWELGSTGAQVPSGQVTDKNLALTMKKLETDTQLSIARIQQDTALDVAQTQAQTTTKASELSSQTNLQMKAADVEVAMKRIAADLGMQDSRNRAALVQTGSTYGPQGIRSLLQAFETGNAGEFITQVLLENEKLYPGIDQMNAQTKAALGQEALALARAYQSRQGGKIDEAKSRYASILAQLHVRNQLFPGAIGSTVKNLASGMDMWKVPMKRPEDINQLNLFDSLDMSSAIVGGIAGGGAVKGAVGGLSLSQRFGQWLRKLSKKRGYYTDNARNKTFDSMTTGSGNKREWKE